MIFYPLLLLLLILDVLPYGVLVKTDRADEITTGPKMVPPVGLLFQFRVALEKLDRDLAFQGTHQLGDRNLRRNRNKQMDMVVPDVQLIDDTLLPLAQRPDIMLDQFLYAPFNIRNLYFGTQTIW